MVTTSLKNAAFGERIGGQKTGLGFTGHLEDTDIGLTYMQQRYYDPVIGRFYSNDPVGFGADNPMMFNRYAYVNNNPYKYVDPDGRYMIPVTYGPNGKLTVNTTPFWSGREGPTSEKLAPKDPLGAALGAGGLAAGLALSSTGTFTPVGALLVVASLDSLRNSWTGKPTLTGMAGKAIASEFTEDKAKIELAGEVGNFTQSMAGGGLSSMSKLLSKEANFADGIGSAGALKDSATFGESIKVYQCSGRIGCGQIDDEK